MYFPVLRELHRNFSTNITEKNASKLGALEGTGLRHRLLEKIIFQEVIKLTF